MRLSTIFVSSVFMLAGTSIALPVKRENMLVARFSDSDLFSGVEVRAYNEKPKLYAHGGAVSTNNYKSLSRRLDSFNEPPHYPENTQVKSVAVHQPTEVVLGPHLSSQAVTFDEKKSYHSGMTGHDPNMAIRPSSFKVKPLPIPPQLPANAPQPPVNAPRPLPNPPQLPANAPRPLPNPPSVRSGHPSFHSQPQVDIPPSLRPGHPSSHSY